MGTSLKQTGKTFDYDHDRGFEKPCGWRDAKAALPDWVAEELARLEADHVIHPRFEIAHAVRYWLTRPEEQRREICLSRPQPASARLPGAELPKGWKFHTDAAA